MSKYAGNQTVPRNPVCNFEHCSEDAVRIICWDRNPYENAKHAWACAKHAEKYAVKED